MPATCALVGHAGVHQREAAAADGGHRRAAVRFGDLRHDAHRVREFLRRRQHREQRALGEAAMADLAALRRADAAGLAGRVRRHVVVEHEAVRVLAHQRVDPLLVAGRAERRYDDRLRLAAREQRRAVRARQHAGADRDRTHRARVAAVDARLAGQDLVADDLRLELEHEIVDLVRVARRRIRRNALGGDVGVDVLQPLLARLLRAQLVGLAQRRRRPRSPWRSSPRPSPAAASPTAACRPPRPARGSC